jgi:hypothetical protein
MSIKLPRRLVAAAIIVPGAIAAFGATAGDAASAPATDVTCTFKVSAQFSPGLKLTTQQVADQVSGKSTACASHTVARGSVTGAGSGPFACTGGEITGQLVFEWALKSGGDEVRSVVAVGGTAGPPSENAVLNGKVVSGQFTGDHVRIAFQINALDLLKCLLPGGLTSESGNAVVDFSRQ